MIPVNSLRLAYPGNQFCFKEYKLGQKWEGKGYLLQYSGLENSRDCIVPWGCKESDTTEQFSFSFHYYNGVPAARGASLVAQQERICVQCRRCGLIPGLGRSPGEGNDTHTSILAWRVPWTEEPGWSPGFVTLWVKKSQTQLRDGAHVYTGTHNAS